MCSAASTAFSNRSQPSGRSSGSSLLGEGFSGMAKPRSQLAEAYDAPYLEYWAALGRFVHEFSRVEYLLQVLLRQVADVSEPVARALFSDARVHEATAKINRVLTERGETAATARLVSPFKQLGDITRIRNNVLHWGAVHDGTDAFLVTNARTAPRDRIREFRLSVRDLEAMSVDLFGIGLHLIVAMRPDGKPEELWNEWRAELEAPWLYKSPQQSGGPAKTNPPRTPKPPRPPRPSQA